VGGVGEGILSVGLAHSLMGKTLPGDFSLPVLIFLLFGSVYATVNSKKSVSCEKR